MTIAITEVAAFAILAAVYCNGALDSFGLASLAKSGSVSFMVPAMSFAVVLGLSLDYDVFLIGRIVEFRMKGYSDKDGHH